MKGSRFSEEIREREVEATTADVCRKHGISGFRLDLNDMRSAKIVVSLLDISVFDTTVGSEFAA